MMPSVLAILSQSYEFISAKVAEDNKHTFINLLGALVTLMCGCVLGLLQIPSFTSYHTKKK